MEKKHLIGKKVRGFEFDNPSIGYPSILMEYEGAIGEILRVNELGAEVNFPGAARGFYYPLDQIEKHLVEDTPSQYEVGMTVYDIIGQGSVINIDSRDGVIEVNFDGSTGFYDLYGSPKYSKGVPTLSLTPYDLVNGGATFPTFKPEVPEIEKGTLVYVRLSKKSEWLMRFFSHFNEDGLAVCFECQNKSGNGVPWREYSLTNPLVDEKER